MNLVSYLKHAIPSWWALARSLGPHTRIAVLSTVWSHHSRRSGYHPVAKGLGVALPVDMRLLPARIWRWITGQEPNVAREIALAMRIARCDRLLVIDGDFQCNLIASIRSVTSARIYAVFHQVPGLLSQCLAQFSSPFLDGAVCVARCQMPLVQAVAPPGKTWFVPHGVDTDYFTPGTSRSAQPSVLCVGCNYRDFDTLRRSADVIAEAVPSTLVRLVAPRSLLPPGQDLGRVELLTGLSDDELLKEYQRAWVVLLPLIDSTANNSLLEAMACGTPVVVTDIGGVRDYAGPECGVLCPPGDPQAHAAAVIGLLLNPLRREAAGRAARARAEIFAWPRVQEKIRAILA